MPDSPPPDPSSGDQRAPRPAPVEHGILSRHALLGQIQRRPRTVAGLAVIVIAAIGVSVGLVARSSATPSRSVASAADGPSTRTVACAGRAIHVTRSAASAIKVTCTSAVDQVGTTQTYVGPDSGAPKTAVPTGTGAGTLLVSVVEAPSTASVSMSGWTKAYDSVSATPGLRLTAWWRIATANETTVSAAVRPASRVTMLTSAFGNVHATHPVSAALAVAGTAVPRADSPAGGGALVVSFAGEGTNLQVGAPAGASGVTTVPNGTEVKTAQAVITAKAGSATPSAWSVAKSRSAVTGVLGLAPAAPAPVPVGATSVAAGASLDVTCDTRALSYVAVSPTVVTVTCEAQGRQAGQDDRGIAATGAATTFASGDSDSPHTGLPHGVKAGNLLISTVSTYDFASVAFGPGWTVAFDVHKPDGVRLVTAWKRMAAGDSTVAATVKPATQVSMATVAFRNVDAKTPVEAAKGGLGPSSPSVSTHTEGALLVLAQGSTAWQLSPLVPHGADLMTTVHTTGNSEVAIAAQAADGVGASSAAAWKGVPSDTSSASGTLAIRPAVPGSHPLAATANSQSPGTSTSFDPNSPIAIEPPAGSAPGSPTPVCGTSVLSGPASAPAGAVTILPSQSITSVVDGHNPGTTYWLAPGVHKLSAGAYDQVIPHTGDTFIGAPGAIVDGRHKNFYAFGGGATDVTISNLTIQNFGAAGGNNNAGVVNHDSSARWTIDANTIQNNAGAGVFIGSNNRLVKNCLRNNGQYGFSAYSDADVSNVVINGNEISGNNTDNWEKREPGCGCTGGGKFWATMGATITNNYVHDNRGAGLWADTNNTGFLIQGNYISGNDDAGVMYEISYNAAILNNTFVRNALVGGPENPGFPAAAIYLSESGSDPRVAGSYGDSLHISGNVFTDNWSGVVAWENADRFAGSPANTSTGVATLVNPRVATEKTCGTGAIVAKSPYLDDCRWKTKNLVVDHNTFAINPAKIPKCTVANTCGFNGLFANYGTYPSWSPYKAGMVEDNITFKQNNVWKDNSYSGPWHFMVHALGNTVSWSDWRAGPYNQDAGSTMG